MQARGRLGRDGARAPVVLVHGPSLSSRDVVSLGRRLAARGHRVLAPDPRGFGSPPPPAGITWPARPHVRKQAEHLLACLDVRGFARAVLFGHHLRSQVAADVAARHPGRVERLILAGLTPDPAYRHAGAQYLRLARPEMGSPSAGRLSGAALRLVCAREEGIVPEAANERSPLSHLKTGALGGLLGTAAMTVVMEALYHRLPEREKYPLPPRELTDSVLPAAARSALKDEDLMLAALAAHAGYGAAMGALYASIDRRPSATAGAVYGVSVWAASYLGWIPAFRLLKPATEHPPRRNALMLTAHVIWGGVLGGYLSRRSAPYR